MSEELEKAYKEIQVQNIVSLERDILEKEELINELLTDFSFKFFRNYNCLMLRDFRRSKVPSLFRLQFFSFF